MNNSKTNLYLKQISETIVNAPSSPTLRCEVDTIPALTLNSGTTGSKTLRTTIATDDNVSTKLTSVDTTLTLIQSNTGTMDTSLNNIETDTGNMDTTLNAIAFDTGNINTSLNNIETDTSNNTTTLYNIDTSLNNIETDIDAMNTSLSNLNANRKLNFSTQYENLQWSGSSNSLSSGDYSSTTGKAWFQNTSGQTAIITKITIGFNSSETSWGINKLFTSSATAGSSWIRWGTADDTTGIDTEIIKFNHNGEMTAFLTRVFDHPSGSGDIYYGWEITGLNILLTNNQYFMCEFNGTINASGDNEAWSGIFLDVKQS